MYIFNIIVDSHTYPSQPTVEQFFNLILYDFRKKRKTSLTDVINEKLTVSTRLLYKTVL